MNHEHKFFFVVFLIRVIWTYKLLTVAIAIDTTLKSANSARMREGVVHMSSLELLLTLLASTSENCIT